VPNETQNQAAPQATTPAPATAAATQEAEPNVQAAPAPAATPDGAPTIDDAAQTTEPQKPRTKEEAYRIISQRLNTKVQSYFQPIADRVMKKHKESIKMRQVFGDTDARDLVVSMWDMFYDILLTPNDDGTVEPTSLGIPGGHGSLQLTTAGATTKMTPQRVSVKVDKRWRVKYSPGKTVDERLSQLPPPPQDAAEDNEDQATDRAPAQTATPQAAQPVPTTQQ
jgi:hypothetical protein